MAKQKTVPCKQQFFDILHQLGQRFSLHQVFDDFLTVTICAFSQNPLTKQSHYEEEYLTIIGKYKSTNLVELFPKALAYLVTAMEEQLEDSLGNDVLGEFFELHISNGRNGQFFTPHPITEFMNAIVGTDEQTDRPLRVLDPACGSGRMLLAAHRSSKGKHHLFGIDIDKTCVKMAVINLFLNGCFKAEVLCGNALAPNDFVVSYKTSLLPFGIFKIEDKEQSLLWHMHQKTFPSLHEKPKEKMSDKIVLNDTPFTERLKDEGSQLLLF